MIKHEYTPEIVCPYCGFEESDSWELDGGNGVFECECGNEYKYYRNIEVTYTTMKGRERK